MSGLMRGRSAKQVPTLRGTTTTAITASHAHATNANVGNTQLKPKTKAKSGSIIPKGVSNFFNGFARKCKTGERTQPRPGLNHHQPQPQPQQLQRQPQPQQKQQHQHRPQSQQQHQPPPPPPPAPELKRRPSKLQKRPSITALERRSSVGEGGNVGAPNIPELKLTRTRSGSSSISAPSLLRRLSSIGEGIGGLKSYAGVDNYSDVEIPGDLRPIQIPGPMVYKMEKSYSIMIKDVKTMLYVRTWEVDVKEEERREARGEKRRHQFEFWEIFREDVAKHYGDTVGEVFGNFLSSYSLSTIILNTESEVAKEMEEQIKRIKAKKWKKMVKLPTYKRNRNKYMDRSLQLATIYGSSTMKNEDVETGLVKKERRSSSVGRER